MQGAVSQFGTAHLACCNWYVQLKFPRFGAANAASEFFPQSACPFLFIVVQLNGYGNGFYVGGVANFCTV